MRDISGAYGRVWETMAGRFGVCSDTPVSACPTQITPDPGLSTLREKKIFSSPKEYLPP